MPVDAWWIKISDGSVPLSALCQQLETSYFISGNVELQNALLPDQQALPDLKLEGNTDYIGSKLMLENRGI